MWNEGKDIESISQSEWEWEKWRRKWDRKGKKGGIWSWVNDGLVIGVNINDGYKSVFMVPTSLSSVQMANVQTSSPLSPHYCFPWALPFRQRRHCWRHQMTYISLSTSVSWKMFFIPFTSHLVVEVQDPAEPQDVCLVTHTELSDFAPPDEQVEVKECCSPSQSKGTHPEQENQKNPRMWQHTFIQNTLCPDSSLGLMASAKKIWHCLWKIARKQQPQHSWAWGHDAGWVSSWRWQLWWHAPATGNTSFGPPSPSRLHPLTWVSPRNQRTWCLQEPSSLSLSPLLPALRFQQISAVQQLWRAPPPPYQNHFNTISSSLAFQLTRQQLFWEQAGIQYPWSFLYSGVD